MDDRLFAIEEAIGREWESLLARSPAVRWLEEGGSDLALYRLYLRETYHYVFHNSRNQALVAVRSDNRDPYYLKYCLRHAYEEVGHEQMALHDLKAVGADADPESFPPPLPETQVLIAYLYWISAQGNPLQRLAYSLWAEDSYRYFGPVLERVRRQMDLKPEQMSFFVEHAKVDAGHSDQVKAAIRRLVHTEPDWKLLEQTALTSLRLAVGILDGVWREFGR